MSKFAKVAVIGHRDGEAAGDAARLRRRTPRSSPSCPASRRPDRHRRLPDVRELRHQALPPGVRADRRRHPARRDRRLSPADPAFLAGSGGARGSIPRPIDRVEEVPGAVGWCLAGRLGRASAPGRRVSLGREAAVSVRQRPLAFAASLIVYGLLVCAASVIARSRSGTRDSSRLSALSTSSRRRCVVAALYGVSRATGVDVVDTGVHHGYPWLPLWLAAAAGVFVVVVGNALETLRGRRRAPRARAARHAPRRRAGGPLRSARLPSRKPGDVRLFEEGQIVPDRTWSATGPSRGVTSSVAQGVLHDVVGGLVGTWVFEDSRWGIVAGQTHAPRAARVGRRLLPVRVPVRLQLAVSPRQPGVVVTGWMTRRRAARPGSMSSAHVRFLLLPFVLLLLVALCVRATPLRAVAFTALMVLQVIVTPEALAAAIACLGTLVLFELVLLRAGYGLAVGLSRVRYCLAAG